MSHAGSPLLRFERARLGFPDRTRLPPLDAEADGQRVGLIGAFSPFFRLLAGEVTVISGAVSVRGVPASEAVARGVVGLCPLDPILVPSWTPERYLTESAILLGQRRAHAQQGARELLSRFELTRIAQRPLAGVSLPERRALLIAHATLGEPPVLCCEAPLARLDEPAQAYVERALERALTGRAGIVSAGSLPPLAREHALLERADRLLFLAHGQIVAAGSPATVLSPSARVLATVTRHGAAFKSELAERGLAAEPMGHVDALLALLVPGPTTNVERFLIDLPAPDHTDAVVESALAADAPLVELSPIDALVARTAAAEPPP